MQMIMRKYIATLSMLFLLCTTIYAQFTVTESFKGSALGGNIITGGSAILTSGNADPVNDGWLRLTPADTNQKGYAYVNSSLPYTMGVIMEFEYKTWRSTADTYNGADGFCVFLFDAATTTFATGGYGGSLGYAPNTGSIATGLSGGYLGVGFDEYGNFSNPSEGRIGGPGLRCNSVTMRGPTTSNASTTNKYLTSVQLQTSASSNVNSIDWNTTTATRPTDATFFRKVKITILPTGTGLYVITVYWQTSASGSYTQLLQYTTTDVPPANLKLGFAASTGGGFNFHEIRNLYITTLGNVRVQKDVDKANANVGNQVTYTVNVTNDNAATLSGVALADTLKNSAGSFLTLGTDFNINSITFNNNGNAATTATGFTNGTAKTTGFTNPWNTTLNIAANSVASFTIVGTILTQPAGNIVKNNVGIDPAASGITDEDLTNNYASANTTVLNPNIDFTISKTVNSPCADATNGNTYTILVSNMGATASVNNTTVTVTDVIPSGCTVQSTSGTGWTVSNSGNTYTFTRKDILKSTFSYSPITIKVKPPTTGTSWVNTATVVYAGTETNTSNNSSSVTLYNPPATVAPITGNDFVTVGSTLQLSSTTTGGSWSVSSTAIATINSTGVVTGVKNGSVTVYYTVGTGCTITVSKTIQVYNKNYWVGGASTNWNTVSNWSDNRIPNVGEDVEFATGSNPAVKDLYVPSGTTTIGNLINQSTQATVIPAGAALIVNGTVTGSDTDPNKLKIEAKDDGTTANGSLILAGQPCNTTIMGTVQMYAKGYKGALYSWTDNIVGSPTFGTPYSGYYRWQHFGVPVQSVVANPTFYGSYLREYSEGKNAAASYYNKWITLNNASNLTEFKGYEITQDVPKIITMQGALSFCNKTITLTRTAAAVDGASGDINNTRYGLGQNIFGNSFTAAIDISTLSFPSDVEKTVYLYNTGSFGNWSEQYTNTFGNSTTSAGSYRAIPYYASAVVGNEIPSMQGFLLRHTGTIGTTIDMILPYAQLIKNTKPQSAPGKNNVSKEDLSYLEIGLNSESTNDKLWMFSQEGTSDNFDNGWDGMKFFGTPTAFIYTPTPDGNMQVSTTNNIIGSYVSFVGNQDTEYTLTVKKANLDNSYAELYLVDLVTNDIIPLDKEEVTYKFTALNNGTDVKRFQIKGKNKNVDLEDSGLNAYADHKAIQVINNTENQGITKVFDVSGKLIYSEVLNATSNKKLKHSFSTGIYIVNMTSAKNKQVVKLVIK